MKQSGLNGEVHRMGERTTGTSFDEIIRQYDKYIREKFSGYDGCGEEHDDDDDADCYCD